jgi:UDP-GlcNAc:undecaprenyl-phosphate GlcNAc-1-phosphate transferase
MTQYETSAMSITLEAAERALSLRVWEVLLVAGGVIGALTLLNLLAPSCGLVDHPDATRKKHARPVPLTGGLSILFGVWLGSLVVVFPEQASPEILALLGIVVAVHAFDDRSGLSARQRLLIDAALSLAIVTVTGNVIETIGTVFGVELFLGPLAFPVTIFMYLALTNAYNMIDGLDGLAITQFLIPLAAIGLWHMTVAQRSGFAPHAFSVFVACLVTLAANLGLLGRYLKCFLGDSGARFLGYFLVYVLILEGQRVLSPIEALYFIALPLLDMCAVVFERLRAGAAPTTGDRRHFHHLLIDAGVASGRVVLIMVGISSAFIAVGLIANIAGLDDLAILLIFLGAAAVYWTSRRSLVRKLSLEPAS